MASVIFTKGVRSTACRSEDSKPRGRSREIMISITGSDARRCFRQYNLLTRPKRIPNSPLIPYHVAIFIDRQFVPVNGGPETGPTGSSLEGSSSGRVEFRGDADRRFYR